MLMNSTLHKRTLCTHWTGQNDLGPNVTPIECHYRTMYSSCSEKENTYVLAYWIGSTVSNRHQIKCNRKTRGSSGSEKGNCNVLYIAMYCAVSHHHPIMYKRHHKTHGSSCSEKGKFKLNYLLLIVKLHTYILHIGETSVMHHHAPLTPL